jgi:tRNA 2-thiouridine synthesizing protein B
MLLHTVNKSPSERNTLESCLLHAGKGSAILLIEDGVYGATKGNACEKALRDKMKTVKVYALKSDLEARGMAESKIEGVELVDYGGFVDLVTQHSSVQSWL